MPARVSSLVTLLLIATVIKWVIKIYRWIKTLKSDGEMLSGKELAAMNQLTWHMNRTALLSTQVGCKPGGIADPNFDENEPFTLEDSMAGHETLHPYPITIPTKELLDMGIALLRGQPVDWPLGAHVVWHTSGYALSKTIDPHLIGSTPALDKEACAKEMEKLRDGADESSINWAGLANGLKAA